MSFSCPPFNSVLVQETLGHCLWNFHSSPSLTNGIVMKRLLITLTQTSQKSCDRNSSQRHNYTTELGVCTDNLEKNPKNPNQPTKQQQQKNPSITTNKKTTTRKPTPKQTAQPLFQPRKPNLCSAVAEQHIPGVSSQAPAPSWYFSSAWAAVS